MELDTNWISEFEIEDAEYKQFYKEKIKSIKIYILYVNKQQELFHIKKETCPIKDTILSKKHLIDILNQHKTYQNKNYTPLSILKYNITLNPDNINNYLLESQETSAVDDFLSAETSIESIPWFDSILFLHNINSLYIVYREKWKSKHNSTKKIYISKKLNRKRTKKRRLKI
jgi:hypothetical protein